MTSARVRREALYTACVSLATLMAGIAAAQAACSTVTPPNIVSCTADPTRYPSGIDFQNETVVIPNLNLTLQNGVVVNNSAGQDGVSIEQSGSLALTTLGTVNINVLGAAADRDGLRVDSAGGSVLIDSTANITTTNTEGDGIIARSNTLDNEAPGFSAGIARGAGNVSVTSSGTILTNGDISTGITAGGAGTLVEVTNSGNITTLGATESGAIVATNYRTVNNLGDTRVTVTGANLSTAGTQSGGIIATTAAGATEINVTGGSVTTNEFQSIGIGGGSGLTDLLAVGPGLVTVFVPVGRGVTINNGTLGAGANDGATINTGGDWGLGISAISRGGPINILNRGAITTTGDVGVGISAFNTFLPFLGAAPAVTIDNRSAITTGGGSAAGIAALAVASPITITSSGAIVTTGDTIVVPEFASLGLTLRAAGIQATGLGSGAIAITTTAGGTIATGGLNADGINAVGASGAVTVTAGDTINTSGTEADGIEARNTSATGSGIVTVNANASVTASGQFSSGIVGISRNAAANVTIAGGVSVMGGWSATPGALGPINLLPAAGVIIGGTPAANTASIATLTNGGNIGALSDFAIASASLTTYLPANGGIRVENSGTVAGFLTLTPTTGIRQNLFNNNAGALFDVRNFADITGDGVRDAKAVSVSNFGGPNAVFNNVGTVRLAEVLNPATTSTAGQYLPAYTTDAAFYDTSRAGVEQGRFDNLQSFVHSGIITLQDGSGPIAGDILKIGAAGGTGTFTSNGGALLIDTVLNQGGPAASRSDVLVVDGTAVGSGATRLLVRNAGGGGAATVGNGILVVDVLDASRSAAGAFALGQPVSAGAYHYGLFQNAVDGSIDGDWYLRSAPRMETGLYPVLPALAARFGLDALGTLHERTGEKTESGNYGGWGRLIGRVRHAGRAEVSSEAHTGIMQVGLDLLRREGPSGIRDDAGLYFSTGRMSADVENGAGALGAIDLSAEGVGAYWTRMGASGWYLDLVGQVTWFGGISARSSEGAGLGSGGRSIIASAEAGVPLRLGAWSLEGQVQLIYQHIALDTGSDGVAQVSYPSFGHHVGRIGARLVTPSEHGLTGFVRANLWNNFEAIATTGFANLNGENAAYFSSELGETWGQVGAGVTWNVNRFAALFANGDYEFAIRNSGHGYSGRVGIKVVW